MKNISRFSLGISILVCFWLAACIPTKDGLPPEGGDPPTSGGSSEQVTASLSAQVWLDQNNNGKYEENEPPVPGVQITFAPLRKDLRTSTAVTDASGWAHRFLAGAPCTAYRIELSITPNIASTTPDVVHGSCSALFGIRPVGMVTPSTASPPPVPIRPTSRPALITPSPLAPEGKLTNRKTSPKDGMVMVMVPAGYFTLGSSLKDLEAAEDEKPSMQVDLPSFWIDQSEVSNQMFSLFVAQTGYTTEAEHKGSSMVWDSRAGQFIPAVGVNWRHPYFPSAGIEGLENHPVLHITWKDAQEYCRWAGRRLPTESEWEKSAKGSDNRRFPWGSQPPAKGLLNFSGTAPNQPPFTFPTGNWQAGASPYNVFDLSGNAREWVDGFYLPYNARTQTALNSSPRILRGGSWLSQEKDVRTTARQGASAELSTQENGFRCAVSQ